jgi:NAD(P)-dependent dehydrogenase (short-subunit alcohol dehydrogenase family)
VRERQETASLSPRLPATFTPASDAARYTIAMNTPTVVASLESFPPDGIALVVGAAGGIGSALCDALVASARFNEVIGLHRRSLPPLDLTREAEIATAAEVIATRGTLRLVIDATGFLHGDGYTPEKSWRELDADHLARAFALNAIGPALLMKHLLPALPRDGKSAFATLSARVGSIGDNRLGGWYAYRASKAALNQLVRTAAIELKRRAPGALCVALHPGTVATRLSTPFATHGLEVHAPEAAASNLLRVLDRLQPEDSGGFFDWRGDVVPW